ncbi:hypothetical protein B0H13DRAFT_1885410 [Mycena leptocephala]|nr:hypothetical protein B0H13DRAFT_1885410 [Mycena leptocephala]
MTHPQDLRQYHKGSGRTSDSTSLPQLSSASLRNWPGLKYSILVPMLGRRLDKGLQNSDWSAECLSNQQLLSIDAATDAHTTLTTYLLIRDEIDQSRQAVPSLWYTFDSVGTRVHTETKVKWKTECPWYSKEQGVGFVGCTSIK